MTSWMGGGWWLGLGLGLGLGLLYILWDQVILVLGQMETSEGQTGEIGVGGLGCGDVRGPVGLHRPVGMDT